MSNYEAGKLYEAVIDEVITDSRQDFEDSGIDESTLQELKRLWCEKLSHAKVCNFAWDEEDQDLHVQQTILGGSNARSDNLHLNSGLELPNMPYDSGLSAIHSGSIGGSNEGAYSMGIEIPTIKQEFNDDTGLIIPKVNQSDGAFELTIEMESSEAIASMEKLKSKLGKQVDGAGDDDDDDDDDIFNDSDDINSDLDDELDSEKSDDDDADQEGRIMLCLYDKVQRVKNKWKCSLKEGIANIEGRDFVFQRATGESEW
ncbi:CIC11C00000005063 [Sungouiella intermedia]|uniref:Transcription initiation factor IIA large subunit n=1 Tax=Sungouiella intermedia TaxID=45354 RepID=A0A1L0GMS1_9ASCO|nr:CIC11C00000005063 [[Candida] intermedia]SGZ57429.1 CIC11C00000005999 [[Candida] intermedia]